MAPTCFLGPNYGPKMGFLGLSRVHEVYEDSIALALDKGSHVGFPSGIIG